MDNYDMCHCSECDTTFKTEDLEIEDMHYMCSNCGEDGSVDDYWYSNEALGVR